MLDLLKKGLQFIDILPGQKTNLLAALYPLAQVAAVFGWIDPDTLAQIEQALAILFPSTLALKATRGKF